MDCANYVACKVSKKNAWEKMSSCECQHWKLSTLYILLVKYKAGCIHTLIQDVC